MSLTHEHLERFVLQQVAEQTTCAECHTQYRMSDLAVVSQSDEAWFVRATCQSCGEQSYIKVLLERRNLEPSMGLPALTTDDVDAVRQFLSEYAGNLSELFQEDPFDDEAEE